MEERNGRLRVSDMTFGFQSWELRSVRAAGKFSSREGGVWAGAPPTRCLVLPFESKGPVSAPSPHLAGPLSNHLCVMIYALLPVTPETPAPSLLFRAASPFPPCSPWLQASDSYPGVEKVQLTPHQARC